ncbi:Cyclin-dependent kinase 2 [Babesia sp. Xinjiang]|uniref:Cyclin-dependent kinase 2 n=1 Tax=Babesia sp. Xinjiang TaxID=462227 RepID=UPI000A25A8D2|nr:Cyclin-dependent kinase 2 [Babesia sp. Xinjiang]ORM42190.1 Cyclin-dependent kinase 2 [Babesia sp. Xinjiang]
MGRSYACAEISRDHTSTQKFFMEGCHWPGEERSPIRYGFDWCSDGHCETSFNGSNHAPPALFRTSCLYPHDAGVAYPENSSDTCPIQDTSKRHSDGVLVEDRQGKRVRVVSKGKLQVSEKALRRFVYPHHNWPISSVTCPCGVVGGYPKVPIYCGTGNHGHYPLMSRVAEKAFPYPQLKGANTCRVPTAFSDASGCARFSNIHGSGKESVVVYLNTDQEIVDVHGWRYVDTLGEGSYGKVYFVRNEFTGEESAFKRMLLQKTGGIPPAILREIHSLKILDHENVIKLNKVYIGDCRVYLSFPRIVGGNLRQFLEKHYPNGMPPEEVKAITKQLIEGIAHIHSKRIIHRDIKPENILVQTDTPPLNADSQDTPKNDVTPADPSNGSQGDAGSSQCGGSGGHPTIKSVMITDFGLSRTHKSVDQPLFHNDDTKLMNSPMSPEVVTLCYRPPELLLGDFHYSFAVDIWSLGCVLFELITGKPIFEERTEFALLIAMFKRFGTPTEEDWPDLTSLPFMNPVLPNMRSNMSLSECVGKVDGECMDLLERMLSLSPQKRIAARDALQHPWIAKC